jgi:hypothetical protein
MNGLFLEHNTIRQMAVPADLLAVGMTGKRMKMDVSDALSAILVFGDSTVGTVEVKLLQHNAATGGTSKALEIDHNYYTQVSAVATTAFTEHVVTTAEDTYDLSTTFTTDPGCAVFEVKGSDLDLANDFAWVSVDLSASLVGTKIASGLYVLNDLRFKPGFEQVV